MSTFGIPPARIFSSRTTKFASEIMHTTNGKGIDVIINSLTGELLDESWRICADGGTMVEIGKVDIVNRNHLSMEPFDRNCSFRPVNFSHKQITDTLIARYSSISLSFPAIEYNQLTLPAVSYARLLLYSIKAKYNPSTRSSISDSTKLQLLLPTCAVDGIVVKL